MGLSAATAAAAALSAAGLGGSPPLAATPSSAHFASPPVSLEGTSTRFLCPFHECAGCAQPFDAFHPPIFLRCHACPTAYHWPCLKEEPRARYELADVITCPNKAGHDAKKVSTVYRKSSGLSLPAGETPQPIPGEGVEGEGSYVCFPGEEMRGVRSGLFNAAGLYFYVKRALGNDVCGAELV